MSANPPKKNKFPCPNNEGVQCWYKERPCSRCGWNPEVKKARLDRIHNTTPGNKNHRK